MEAVCRIAFEASVAANGWGLCCQRNPPAFFAASRNFNMAQSERPWLIGVFITSGAIVLTYLGTCANLQFPRGGRICPAHPATSRSARKNRMREARTIRVHMIEIVNKLTRTSRQLVQSLEREPTSAEIAKQMDIPEAMVRKVHKIMRVPISLETPLAWKGILILAISSKTAPGSRPPRPSST